jgi:hypothetical protein
VTKAFFISSNYITFINYSLKLLLKKIITKDKNTPNINPAAIYPGLEILLIGELNGLSAIMSKLN